MTLTRELADRIAEHGPLTVAEYMARCNAHYYATRDPFGAQGDFTTAPEISQIFGELIGAWLADLWQRMGGPRCVLVEPGPGRGTLMADLLRATRRVNGFHDALDIRLIETSLHLIAKQKQTLEGAHPRITWHADFSHLPALPLLLIANEFFDALPVHQYVAGDRERHVDYVDGALVFTPTGEVKRERSAHSRSVVQTIASHISRHNGCALIIDYGYAGGTSGDTLQAVRRHAFTDPLAGPGEADLTAHVDFAGLLQTACTPGDVMGHGPVEQGTFLKRLGAELRAMALCRNAAPGQQQAILSGLERLVAPHQMGSLFKVIALTREVAPPPGFC